MGVFLIAALAGVGVGLLSGMLGIGGGVVMVPLFTLAFGLPAIQATATSLFSIIPTSVSGVIGHLRHRTCVVGVGVAAGLAGACTSPLGVHLASISPSWAIMLAAALIIGYSAYNMLGKALRMPRAPKAGESPQASNVVPAVQGDSASDAAGAGAGTAALANGAETQATGSARAQRSTGAAAPARTRATRRQLFIGAASGLVAGLASGYVGVGGGFIMVPLFTAFAGISMKQASGTSLIAVAILAVPGAVTQLMLGNVQLLVGLAVAAGSIPGALWGASLVRRVPERTLRLLFGALLLVAAVVMVGREFVVL